MWTVGDKELTELKDTVYIWAEIHNVNLSSIEELIDRIFKSVEGDTCRFCLRPAEFRYKFSGKEADAYLLCGPCSNGVDHGMDLFADFEEAVELALEFPKDDCDWFNWDNFIIESIKSIEEGFRTGWSSMYRWIPKWSMEFWLTGKTGQDGELQIWFLPCGESVVRGIPD